MIILRKFVAIFMVLTIGIPFGMVVGVISFFRFPFDLLKSTFKSIDEDAEFERVKRNKLAKEGEKGIWERHIERMNNN